MSITCRICDNKLVNDDAELMKDIPKDISDAFVFEPNLEKNWDRLICNVCYEKLLAVFEFMSTCTRSDIAIVPFVDWKNPSEIDLRDIYLKQKENKHIAMSLEEEKVCRLCMKLTGNVFVPMQEMDLDGLEWLLPDIHLIIIKDPVMCNPCFESFTTHSNFLKSFLSRLGNNSGHLEIELDSVLPSLESFGETEGSDINSWDELELYKKEIEENGHTYIEGEDIGKEMENTRLLTSEIYPVTLDCNVSPKNYHMTQREPFEVEMYKCGTCDFKTKFKSNLRGHELRHKDPSQVQMYKCDTCDFKTKLKKSLRRHGLKHKDASQVQMYKCDACDHETKYKDKLKRHQLMHKDPSQVQMYKCDTCDFETKFKRSLQNHELRHKDASQVQMYLCDTCDYKTKLKWSLRSHELRHKDPSQVQMYQCDTCDFKTKFKSSLQTHELRHKVPSQVQMYRCDICDFKTKFKKNLGNHELKHKDASQVEMYECNTCDFKTKFKSSLQRHELGHKNASQVQMYKCDTCDFKTKLKKKSLKA